MRFSLVSGDSAILIPKELTVHAAASILGEQRNITDPNDHPQLYTMFA